MKTVHVRIPDAHLAQLQQIAADRDRDLSWLMRKIVREYLQTDAETSIETSQHAPPRTVTQRVLGVLD
jgi:predicted transcriptional regulator